VSVDHNLSITKVCSLTGENKSGEITGSHPVHGSTTESNFWINPTKNTWHCFRHKTGGGPLMWIAVKEGIIDCSEAESGALQGDTFIKVAEIANEKYDAGININNLDEEELDRRKKALEVLNKASELSHGNLVQKKTDILENIKKNRNFDQEIIENVEIGFLSYDVADTLIKRFNKQALKDSGLFGEDKKEDKLYCHLANRIVFPYQRHGSTYFMIGRKLPESDSDAKYKKTHTTEYNKHILLEYKVKDRNSIVITEGVTDGISAYKSGYNTVSPVTTRFRDEDVEKVLNRVRDFEDVYIAMDQDEGGQDGAEKTAKALVKAGIEPKIVELEEGYDLDDWTTENGYNIEPLLENSEYFLDLKIEELEDVGKRDESGKVKETLTLVKNWDSSDVAWLVDEISEHVNLRKSEIRDIFEDITEESTEQTEQTEQTEEVSVNTNSRKGYVFNNNEQTEILEKLANQQTTDKKRLIGTLNDQYFFTAWIQDQGLEKPAIVTKNSLSYIKHKLTEKEKKLDDEVELSDEQKEKYDYYYAEIDGKEIRFIHEIPKSSKQAINNLDNRILHYIIGNKETRSKEEIYDDMINLISQYWSHYQKEWYDVTAAYNLHTYLLPELGYTVYILLKGKPQTGKTTWQKVNAKLNYNGCFAGNLTPATAVRYAHSYFSTLHQDEMEKQSEERKNTLQGLYNTGQRKGGVYNITNTDAGTNVAEQIQEIQSFCGKSASVNDIYGFADSFMSRNIILKTVKTKQKGLYNIDSPPKEHKNKFENLQAEIAYYVLENWEEIIDDIEEVRKNIDDTARDEDKMACIKGLVKHFKGDERASAIEDRLRDSERLQDVNKVGERVTRLFEIISAEFKSNDKKLVSFKVSKLKDDLNDELNLEDSDDYSATSKSVIKKLREYDVLRRDSQKKKDKNGYTAVEINREEFLDACNRYELGSVYQSVVGSQEDTPPHEDNSIEKPDQFAQFAQSAQSLPSKNRKVPSTHQVKRKIKDFSEDGQGADIQELIDYFDEAYTFTEKQRKRFDPEEFTDEEPIGLAKLLHGGEAYEPKPGFVEVLE